MVHALRTGGDLHMMMRVSAGNIYLYWGTAGRRPYLLTHYLYPLEAYRTHADGSANLASLITATDPLYLGAGQPGKAGTPVKITIKNWSDITYDLVEAWDNRPEWTEPYPAAGNGGDGALDHVRLAGSAVSQQYTIVFYSSTQYEVVGTAHGDNPNGLHLQIDEDPDWRGSTGADWSAPEGGLTIPAAAWSGSPQIGDTFVLLVSGNTTPTEWPADSADHVQITHDTGGAADPDGWRNIHGARTESTAAVTVDATTVAIPVRYTEPTHWTVGEPAWIGDPETGQYDEGVLQAVTTNQVTIEGLTITNNSYGAGSRVCSTLPLGTIGPSVRAELTSDAASGQARLYLDSTAGFSIGQTVQITDPVTEANGSGEVANVEAEYIDLTAVLAQGYATGSLVAVAGTGEVSCHIRRLSASSAPTGERRVRIKLPV
jgi:hypothetical protein